MLQPQLLKPLKAFIVFSLSEHQQDLINPESDSLNERLREADELFNPGQTYPSVLNVVYDR